MTPLAPLAFKLPWAADADGFWSDSFLYLMLVLCGLLVIQVGIVAWIWATTTRQRRRIPLVVGGWGTRGKSGTERCKAALFHGYGAKVFSKTTGCEAMFIAAMPRQPADEIFLFRPMEKATIYEQVDVLKAAGDLGCEVFLYECMALNPRYVEVLQDGWMRDDIGTLTNAYPDHEDVQGPAGRNVAEVIGAFAPRRSVTWTCERQMLPILEQRARERGAELRPVSWIDAALITDDVLERLPYQEHPANLALVSHLAANYGVSQDFVLKEIADNLVPDLGVLRTFPRIHVAGRSLYFTNGMSANERLGCLGNWKRLGFADHECRKAPRDWLVCVLNNRADRIPRSKVFAAIVAEDLSAHAYVLIGSNVAGLVGYIDEAMAAARHLWQVSDCTSTAQIDKRLQDLCERLKLVGRHPVDCTYHARLTLLAVGYRREAVDELLDGPVWHQALQAAGAVAGTAVERGDDLAGPAWAQVRHGLVTAVKSLPKSGGADLLPMDVVDTDTVVDHLGRFWRELRLITSLQRQTHGLLRSNGVDQAGDEAVRGVYEQVIRERLTVIEDNQANGDQIIQTIVEAVPPGHDAHILGMQNIKGTGLDFAYRWVGLLRVHDWLHGLRSPIRSTRLDHLKVLAGYSDWHHYEARLALTALIELRSHDHWQHENDRVELDRVTDQVRAAVAGTLASTQGGGTSKRWYDILAGAVEPILDLGDSILRRVAYQRTLGEYVAGGLSRVRTAAIMQGLVKRQKGGWFKHWLDGRLVRESEQADADKAELPAHLRPYQASDFAATDACDPLALDVLDDVDLGAD